MPDDLPVPEATPDNVGMPESPDRFSSWSGKYAHNGDLELSFFSELCPPHATKRTPRESDPAC